MVQIKESQVEAVITVCPYCMDEVSHNKTGCCGESSCHFETAVVYDGMAYLENEIDIIEGQ
jgi:hypothetical protein